MRLGDKRPSKTVFDSVLSFNVINRQAETPVRLNDLETPGTRMIWDATPAPITPGNETPGRVITQSARKRWDETPRADTGLQVST
jgi:hypothetical protein